MPPGGWSGVPSYWNAQTAQAAADREAMPGLDRLQTQYVRYKRFSEAQVTNTGWDLGTSRRNHECMGTSDLHPILFSSHMPDAVSMHIVEAPAEFAMPVKQDRRLNPPFRVRVDVHHRGNLSFPLTLRASLITQQDKDNMLTWSPDDGHEARPITELKGTTNIAHHFEAHAPGSAHHGSGSGTRKGKSAGRAAASSASPLPEGSGQIEMSSAPPMGQQQGQPQQWGGPEQGPPGHDKYVEQFLMQQMTSQGPHHHPQMGFSQPFPHGFPPPGFPGFQPAGLFQPPQGMGQPYPHFSQGLPPHMQQGLPPHAFPIPQGFPHGFTFHPGLAHGMPLNLSMHPQYQGHPNQMQGPPGQQHQQPQEQQQLLQQQQQQQQQSAQQQQPQQQQQQQQQVPEQQQQQQQQLQNQEQQSKQEQQPAQHQTQHDPQQVVRPQPQQPQYHAFQPYQVSRGSSDSQHPQAQQQQHTLQPPAPLNLGSHMQSMTGQQPQHQQAQELEAKDGPIGQSSFEFEFVNIEFLKPTRMNKVYMVFACTIMDLDTLYIAYNVPTIGICRAEQREKACQKLGIPAPSLNLDLGSHSFYKEEGGSRRGGRRGPAPSLLESEEPQLHRGARNKGYNQRDSDVNTDGLHSLNLAISNYPENQSEENMSQHEQELMAMHQLHQLQSIHPMQHHQAGLRKREAGSQLTPSADEERAGGRRKEGPFSKPQVASYDMPHTKRESSEEGAPGPYSRAALQELIMEEYESTGLKRKLTKLDLQALLSQAGFPSYQSSAHAEVSQGQWEEFIAQFRATLDLLRQISSVWNVEDPCVISGFDMDRQGTVQALVNEPSGTFICRFSMSQPGCLVLSCKMAGPEHDSRADMDGLVHAIIHVNDLYERRVDTWIRDFSGATHVLDVYRQKRVDKRKVFTSNYTRLTGGQKIQQPQPTGALPPPSGPSPFASLQMQPQAAPGTALPLSLAPKEEDMNDDALMADVAAAAAAPPSAAITTQPPEIAAEMAAAAAGTPPVAGNVKQH